MIANLTPEEFNKIRDEVVTKFSTNLQATLECKLTHDEACKCSTNEIVSIAVDILKNEEERFKVALLYVLQSIMIRAYNAGKEKSEKPTG